MKPTFRLLTDKQQSSIAVAAFELVERVGVKLTESEAQALLHGAGARVEGDRVYIPAHLVEEAIQSAPRGISIYARNSELAMQLEGRNYYYGAHTDAPDVLDPFTHERRPCQRRMSAVMPCSLMRFLTSAIRPLPVWLPIALLRSLTGSLWLNA